MVSATEFVELQQNQAEKNGLKLATVTSLSDILTARVTFFGEDTESQKGYSYSSTYKPVIGDTVLMLQFADTYIIACKVMLPTDAPIEPIDEGVTQTELDEQLALVLDDYVKDTDIAGVVKLNEYGTIGIANAIYYSVFPLLKATDIFFHTGAKFGMFGTQPVTKVSVTGDLSSTATTAEITSKVNAIRSALNRIGAL